jgi:hypothetical protein
MFDTLCSWHNLYFAYQKAARGKRGKPYVAAFEYQLEENLLDLQQELSTQQYRPGPYYSFYIHDPKQRLISAAPFRDRVVHHALCNLIEPVMERSFVADSYANRKGKGTHKALRRCQLYARQYPYVLQCDIRQFFPSLDHEILCDYLATKFPYKGLRWLIHTILSSGAGILQGEYDMVYFPGDDLFAACRHRGLPIGNLTSQFWANCYLNPFDHFVKRQLRCRAYIRYVDDLLLFAETKAQLWSWLRQIRAYLAKLRLTIHAGAHPRPVSEGIGFLGFVIRPDRRRLKRRNAVNFTRRFKRLLEDYAGDKIPVETLANSFRGWQAHAVHGNTRGLRRSVRMDLCRRFRKTQKALLERARHGVSGALEKEGE